MTVIYYTVVALCMSFDAGSYSNWKRTQPYNPTGNINCAVLETTDDDVYWTDYACSRSDIGALCDHGPGIQSARYISKLIN